MKRLHLLMFLFLVLLLLDETLGGSHKSSKEGKKKKSGDKTKDSKKVYSGSLKEHKRTRREIPAEVDENEVYQEVEVEEPYKSTKASKKSFNKEEAGYDKYSKKNKLKEESYRVDKKKLNKKFADEWNQKQSKMEGELDEEFGNENFEREIYATKDKKRMVKKTKTEKKQKYNVETEPDNEGEIIEEQPCYQAEDEIDPETELDVAIPTKKNRRVQRKEREIPAELDENEVYQEVEVEEPYKSTKASKKRINKEEAAHDKYSKKNKLKEENYRMGKKKLNKKCTDKWNQKQSQIEEEVDEEFGNENLEREIYVPKDKKKTAQKTKTERKQKYNVETEPDNEGEIIEEEQPCCQAEDEIDPETELDVAIPAKKSRRVQRYIVEPDEGEGNEVDSISAEKCYYT